MRGRRITFQESERLMPTQLQAAEAGEDFIYEDCYSEDLLTESESNSVNENVWNIGQVKYWHWHKT